MDRPRREATETADLDKAIKQHPRLFTDSIGMKEIKRGIA
jgi:hypothetical protein